MQESHMITGAQIRAARGLLKMSVKELSEATTKFGTVSESTIKRMELTDDPPNNVMSGNIESVRKALEAAGIQFIPENGGKPGVRPK